MAGGIFFFSVFMMRPFAGVADENEWYRISHARYWKAVSALHWNGMFSSLQTVSINLRASAMHVGTPPPGKIHCPVI